MEKTLGFPKFYYMGRLANMLFELASAYGIAKRAGRELVLPCWPYEEYFKGRVRLVERMLNPHEIRETGFSYCGDYFQMKLNNGIPHLDISGFLQSEKYFEHCKEDIKAFFTWEDKFSHLPVYEGVTTAIHVRRGDYVGHEGYINLPVGYYITSLRMLGRQNVGRVLVFSDDISWCKKALSLLAYKVEFIESNKPIEDLYLMSRCTNFIIANSTFSWWGAWLGEGKGRIIHPGAIFKGSMANYNIKDYFPERWEENKLWNRKPHST